MKIKDVLNNGIEILIKSNVDEPRNKARILLSNILSIPKEKLIIKLDEEIEENIKKRYFDDISKLINNIPIQYIVRKTRIYEIKFFS